MDFYNFYTGKEFEAYQYLGAHVWDGGTTFRTFAPAAQRVSVIGEFNGWTETPMNRVHDGNFWECTMNNVGSDLMYNTEFTVRTAPSWTTQTPMLFIVRCVQALLQRPMLLAVMNLATANG